MQETNASILLLEMPVQWPWVILYCRTAPPSSAKQIRGMIRGMIHRDGTRLEKKTRPRYSRLNVNALDVTFKAAGNTCFYFVLVSCRVRYYRSGVCAHLQIEALIR